MTYEEVYHVWTEGDEEGRSRKTLGYAAGDVADIRAFYDNQRFYQLHLEKIRITKVDPSAVREKRDLLQERDTLERRLAEIKETLGR